MSLFHLPVFVTSAILVFYLTSAGEISSPYEYVIGI